MGTYEIYSIYDSSTQKSISKRQQNLIFCMRHDMVVSEIWEWMTYGYVEGVTAE